MPARIDTLDGERLRVASRFINARYLADDARAELRAWFAAGSGGPRTLTSFLEPGFACELADALREYPGWTRHTSVHEGHVRTVEVPEAQWAGHPVRAARHCIARSLATDLDAGRLPAAHRRALIRFVGFAVTGPYLLSWLASVVGQPLDPRTSFEFTCYLPGDQITEHDDLLPGRVLAANFYLDPDYRGEDGGQLWYRDEQGGEHLVEPTFNSFTLIPIRAGCMHRVEPYTGAQRGRYTANLQIHTEY